MALFNPTKRAQMAHVTNLISMARFDGLITQNEEDYIVAVAKEFGFTQAELDQCFKDSDNLVIEIPKSDDDKVEYMKNLVSMMLSDGTIDQQKRNFVERMCEKFGYNGKEAVDILYNELMQEVRGSQPDNTTEGGSEMTEEEYQEELHRRIEKGAKCLMENDMSGAFDQLLYPALADETARRLFMRIPRGIYPLFMINDRQVEEMKKLSDEGFAVAQFALGRYHYLVQPDDDSIKTAGKLFASAAAKGLAEAIFGLALVARYDNIEESDIDKFTELRDEAIQKGSVRAICSKAKDLIYGWDDYKADPQSVIDGFNEILKGAKGDSNVDVFNFEPEYYEILGRAYEKIGDKEKAEEAYIRAVSMGYYESLSNLIIMKCCDEDGNITDPTLCDEYVKFGIEHNDAYCFTLRGCVKDDEYNALSSREKAKKTAAIKADLEKAYQLGDNMAALLLGYNYYYGSLGFGKNEKEAWEWFNLGAVYGSSGCFGMMAQMISDGHCPREANDKFRAFCLLCAYRRGDESKLEEVIEAYQNGLLDDYKNEIEKYYLPKYVELGDTQTDSGLVDEGVPLIAIIHPDATADIIEFDVCEWDELPAFIGADHLDALRMPGLYEIGHQAGYEENVTGWLDSKGLMKGLPQNAIGRKVYPGPVAGDMILTLEDASYKPMSFYDINALRRVIEALGATVENVCLDDGPDDDGRFDAWA